MQSKLYTVKDYNTEEKIYEYVERNTYYLIMAITIFLLVSTSKDITSFMENKVDFNLVVYSQALAIVFCIGVLALFWMPTDEDSAHCLVHLRHIKTVFFTYALSLFLISPVEILTKLRLIIQ